MGPPLGRTPRPCQCPGRGRGRVLKAVHAGEAKNMFGEPRTATPLGGESGRAYVGASTPKLGGGDPVYSHFM